MSVITVLYVLLVVAGIAWVVHRFRLFMRDERERESRWNTMASDERLNGFLESVKREKEVRDQPRTRSDLRKPS
jgi:hypothetical protein